MAQYIIEMRHDAGQCMQALNECQQQSDELLQAAQFGCRSGVHTAWVQVRAESPEQARMMLPQSQQNTARVVQVEQFTQQQLQQMEQAA